MMSMPEVGRGWRWCYVKGRFLLRSLVTPHHHALALDWRPTLIVPLLPILGTSLIGRKESRALRRAQRLFLDLNNKGFRRASGGLK